MAYTVALAMVLGAGGSGWWAGLYVGSAQAAEPEPGGGAATVPVASPGDLTVTVDGLKGTSGHLWVTIFDSAEGWTRMAESDAAAFVVTRVTGSSARATLHGLPGGTYAIAVFHDQNANGDLDMSGGYPLEGGGVSNARGAMDMPDFARAAVRVDGGAAQARVRMHYP